MARFVPEVERLLRDAGWSPGRAEHEPLVRWAAVVKEFGEMPHAARQILAEFGGLTVGKPGPGVAQARGSIAFDPTLLVGESDRFPGSGLYPLGEVDGGHGFLLADKGGRIWVSYLGSDAHTTGADIDDALDRILLGRGRP